MTTFADLAALGARLDAILDELRVLAADMKPHAVYSGEGMEAALISLCKARTGLAQSVGYAALHEQRPKAPC